jgi:hypothetical protein
MELENMAGNWMLEILPSAKEAGSARCRLQLKDTNTGQVVELTPQCGSLEELQNEISQIKSELDRFVEKARQEFKTLERGQAEDLFDPRVIWKKMEEFASEKQMIEYFNALSEAERERTAEYVFAHVNMFKGRGPVFSEHYDTFSRSLE